MRLFVVMLKSVFIVAVCCHACKNLLYLLFILRITIRILGLAEMQFSLVNNLN